jgi:hypothetical protein
VFLVNSRLGLFTATPSRSPSQSVHVNGASLLPKLRDHFAEFLNEGSLERLRILSRPTCVGLRYGHPKISLEAFLVSVGSTNSLKKELSITSQSYDRLDLPGRSSYWLRRALPIARWSALLRHPIAGSDPRVVLEY